MLDWLGFDPGSVWDWITLAGGLVYLWALRAIINGAEGLEGREKP